MANVWSIGNSKAASENDDTKEIGTSSCSIAASQGYEDGEKILFDGALDVINGIVASTNPPVTADVESAYAGGDLEKLKKMTSKILDTGVVGINFEDQVIGSDGQLYSIEEQSSRIVTIRKVAEKRGASLFINARTDLFFRGNDKDHPTLIDEAVRRVFAYKDAGANGFFAPGLENYNVIKNLCDQSPLPVNIIVQSMECMDKLLGIGVSRFSTGPFPYIAAIDTLKSFLKK